MGRKRLRKLSRIMSNRCNRILAADLKLVFFLFFVWICVGCDRDGSVVQASARTDHTTIADHRPGITSRRVVGELGGVNIRVFLSKQDEIKVICRGDTFAVWSAEEDGVPLQLAAERKYRFSRGQRQWVIAALPENAEAGQTVAPIVIGGDQIELRPGPKGFLSAGEKQATPYRGVLRCLGQAPGRFALVNVVDIEDYLLGVVGKEVYAYWHKPTLRAQSIAARTYALYQMHCRQANDSWDIGSDQSSQMYGGVAGESARIAEAVKDTRGVVLAYGAVGKEKIFPTYYSAVCGGHTQNAEPVFGQRLMPLTGQGCRYCQAVAPAQRYRWPSVTISKAVASDLLIKRYSSLASLKKIVNIRPVAHSDYGRAEKIALTGSNQQRCYVRAEDFRLALSQGPKPLLSSWYRMVDAGDAWRFEDGRGWGHGVGLCQYGSEQMASQGSGCVQILQHYYPGAVLVRAY